MRPEPFCFPAENVIVIRASLGLNGFIENIEGPQNSSFTPCPFMFDQRTLQLIKEPFNLYCKLIIRLPTSRSNFWAITSFKDVFESLKSHGNDAGAGLGSFFRDTFSFFKSRRIDSRDNCQISHGKHQAVVSKENYINADRL